jgi:hypothetical protein
VNDELSEKIPEGKIPEEIHLELLAPWYSENKRDSRTLDLFDAIPKYPFAVTTTIPKLERLEVPFTLRGQRYTALVAPARITDARTKEERLMFPGSREELVERALRFIAVQQIAKTKLTPDAQTGTHSITVFFTLSMIRRHLEEIGHRRFTPLPLKQYSPPRFIRSINSASANSSAPWPVGSPPE